jgi:small subunit ribosomal protein S16
MLVIRLTRVGKKNQPTYRVVVQEKARDPWGRSVEILGNYNPRSTPKEFVVKEDRVKYWISKGAQPSPTVHNLLVDAKVIEGPKLKNTTKDKLNTAKAAAKKDKKKKEAAAKPEEAKPEEKPAEEKPAEEAPAEEKPAEEKPAEEAPAEEPKEEDKKEEVSE